MYRERRERLLETLGEGAAVIPSARPALRNNDVEHPFRQDSDFYYLTGFTEPRAVLLLTNRHPEHRAVLFLEERNPEREVWDGPRLGVERAVSELEVDAAFPIGELSARLPDYLAGVRRLHYRLGRDRAFDSMIFDAIDAVRPRARRGIDIPQELVELATTLHEARLFKSDEEIETMRRAVHITGEAHAAAMRKARPGVFEYEVEAEIERVFRAQGSAGPAYGSIVGSGPNATVLHYRRNDRRMEEGDLLLVDAGCEYAFYASDVTRTFPVSGRFSKSQRAVYEVVLAAQLAAIEAVRPGATLDDVHRRALETLVDGIIELGFVSGSREEVIEKESYKPYYMHRTSHWLGMDVHDVGAYFVDGKPRPLEPGMVLTVEPGLYVATSADVDAQFRGIGVRIEDDVQVTATGAEVLSAEIPKTVEEIEARLADRGSAAVY